LSLVVRWLWSSVLCMFKTKVECYIHFGNYFVSF
jgi:hypothetical protein